MLLFISPSTEQSGKGPTWNLLQLQNHFSLKRRHIKNLFFLHFKTTSYFISLGAWKDLKTYQSMSLGKRSWLITPFQFLMASSKSISGLQITHKSREPVNVVTDRQNFTRGSPGTNFKFIPYLKVEIQGVGECVRPTPCALTIVEKKCTLEGLVP